MYGRARGIQSCIGRRAGPLLFATSLLCAVPGQAQELSVFLEGARKHNFDVREAAALTAQRTAEASQRKAELYPRLTAQGLYTRNEFEAVILAPVSPGAPPERITILPRNQLDAYFTVDVPLIDLTQWARIRSENTVAEATRLQQTATGINAEGAVVQAYYNLLGAQALVRASKQAIQATEEIVAWTKSRVAAGVASPVDEARVVSELSLKRRALAEAERAAAIGAQNLFTLTSITPQELVIPPRDALEPEAPAEAWLAHVDSVPAVKAAVTEARASRILADAAWTVFVPTLSGKFVERLTNATGFANAVSFYQATLAATWRLDPAAFSAVRAEKASADVAEVRAERARQNVYNTIYSNWQQVKEFTARLAAARAAREANQVAVRILLERYEAGTASSFELSQADRDLFATTASEIQAEADLATARAYLRLSVGLPYNARGPTAPAEGAR